MMAIFPTFSSSCSGLIQFLASLAVAKVTRGSVSNVLYQEIEPVRRTLSLKFSTAMFKTKILILGPCGSGKSTIANYLSDATEIIGGEYRPTHGVRIVEFESNDLEMNGKNIDAEVELWDCSGDRKFEKCWPAIQKDANGVILVCNPAIPAHAAELEQWYSMFVARRGIKPEHTIGFLHSKPDSSANDDFRLPVMSGLQIVATNIEQDGEALRLEFNNFLCNVIAGLTERRENEERDILG